MPEIPKVSQDVADTPVKPNCSLAKIAEIRLIKGCGRFADRNQL